MLYVYWHCRMLMCVCVLSATVLCLCVRVFGVMSWASQWSNLQQWTYSCCISLWKCTKLSWRNSERAEVRDSILLLYTFQWKVLGQHNPLNSWHRWCNLTLYAINAIFTRVTQKVSTFYCHSHISFLWSPLCFPIVCLLILLIFKSWSLWSDSA